MIDLTIALWLRSNGYEGCPPGENNYYGPICGSCDGWGNVHPGAVRHPYPVNCCTWCDNGANWIASVDQVVLAATLQAIRALVAEQQVRGTGYGFRSPEQTQRVRAARIHYWNLARHLTQAQRASLWEQVCGPVPR